MQYLLKKCRFQELGSVKDGKAQRGRYLMLSKEVVGLFPPLSTTQLNDSAILPILPLYSNQKIYCSYTYHNSKYHNINHIERPRDEYRLYLNKQLEQGQLLFNQDDIVIIRVDHRIHGDEQEDIYLLDLISNHTSDLYLKLTNFIQSSNIRGGGYVLYDGNIEEFENKVKNITAEESPKIGENVINTIEKFNQTQIENLFNVNSFRDFVMVGYNSLCAITGTAIGYNNYINIEAAHIRPKSHGGSFGPNNGIALCRDMHWAFDKGFLTLSDEYKVIVHPKITSNYICNFHDKQITIPEDQFFRPAYDNIKYHRENIYGLFLTSGRL